MAAPRVIHILQRSLSHANELSVCVGDGFRYRHEPDLADLKPDHESAAILISAADVAGVAALPLLRQRFPAVPRIVYTGHFNATEAWRFRGFGATHYFNLDCLGPRLRDLLDGTPARTGADPVFTSRRMLELVASVKKIAALDVSVLLLGESGTGKEVLADLLHRHSARHAQPFVKVNCAALPRELIESELFGSVRGSYTGSTGDKRGLFRRAHGGTLLLDELAEMPVDTQAKLLRVLQDREVRPVGGEDSVKVDVRLVAATNQEPRSAIAAGRLRADLYYRVALGVFSLPPLRARREEIPALTSHFLAVESARLGLGAPPVPVPETLAALQAHAWPGNIRQLQGVLIRALVAAAQDGPAQELLVKHLEFDLMAGTEGSEEQETRDALAATGGSRGKTATLLGISVNTLDRRLVKHGITRK